MRNLLLRNTLFLLFLLVLYRASTYFGSRP